MKKCSCRDSNSRLLIESTVSYPLDHQDNNAGKCNYLLKNEATCMGYVIVMQSRAVRTLWHTSHPDLTHTQTFSVATFHFIFKNF